MDRKIQQGDVLIRSCGAIPKLAKRKNDTVVAYGEVTNHKHEVIGENVEIYADERGILYISAPQGGVIRHEEHKPIALASGDYVVGIVREFDHFAEEARNVAD